MLMSCSTRCCASRRGRAALLDEAAAEASTASEEEESEEEEEEAETDESSALFRGAICREVDDLLTKGELAPKATAVLTALRSEGTDSASPVDRALCRLARAAYAVYRLDRDRGELRQALIGCLSGLRRPGRRARG